MTDSITIVNVKIRSTSHMLFVSELSCQLDQLAPFKNKHSIGKFLGYADIKDEENQRERNTSALDHRKRERQGGNHCR